MLTKETFQNMINESGLSSSFANTITCTREHNLDKDPTDVDCIIARALVQTVIGTFESHVEQTEARMKSQGEEIARLRLDLQETRLTRDQLQLKVEAFNRFLDRWNQTVEELKKDY